MTQIRNTIDLLTKILQANGTTHLKAETFRLAKFDRPEAVLPLWRLLFELVCYCEYGKIDEFVLEAYNQLSSDEVVVYVKRELQTKGYYSLDFARLPKDMRRGSRELLLAFGWLLSNSRVIEKFVMSRTSVLEDDTAGIYAQDELTNDRLNSSLNLLKLPGDIYSRIKQLLWLNNKLRLNLCSLHSMQCQRSRLKHKIQAATVGTKQVQGKDHLSMLEVYLVRNPEFLKKNIDLLERDSERLHDLLTWKDHDGVFWKWMESVLEAKLQPQEDGASSSDEETVSLFSSGEADVRLMASSRLQESHRTLQEAIVKYEAIVQHIERLCVEKSHEVSSEELDDIISGMSLELSIQKANIALHGQQNTIARPATRDRTPVEPSFVLEKKPVQPKARLSKPGSIASHTESQSSFTSLLSHNQSNNATTDIDDEIDCMQQHLLSLEKDLGVKQSYLKMEMEKLSGKLNDAVCIPPLNRNLNRETRLN